MSEPSGCSRHPAPGCPITGAGLTDVTVHPLANDDVLKSPLFPGLKLRLRDDLRSACDLAPARR